MLVMIKIVAAPLKINLLVLPLVPEIKVVGLVKTASIVNIVLRVAEAVECVYRLIIISTKNLFMELLPNEEMFLRSKNDTLIITNKRVYYSEKSSGYSYSFGVFLENISSVEHRYRDTRLFLWIAILFPVIALCFGIADLSEEQKLPPIGMSLLLGVVFLIFWLFSRKKDIKISSDGGAHLHVPLKGLTENDVKHLVDKVQEAKDERISQLYNTKNLAL